MENDVDQKHKQLRDDFREMMGAIMLFKEKHKLEEVSLVINPSSSPIVRVAADPHHIPKLTDNNGSFLYMGVTVRFGNFRNAVVLD